MKVLVFINPENNQVSVLLPFSNRLNLKEIGEKDIPNEIPFWEIDQVYLPVDMPQETWKLENMGEPLGYGKRI